MRFRLGFIVGFGLGYYVGARAGRERFEDINRLLRKVKRSDTFETAADKARSAMDNGVDRARVVMDSKIGSDGAAEAPVDTVWPTSAEPGLRP